MRRCLRLPHRKRYRGFRAVLSLSFVLHGDITFCHQSNPLTHRFHFPGGCLSSFFAHVSNRSKFSMSRISFPSAYGFKVCAPQLLIVGSNLCSGLIERLLQVCPCDGILKSASQWNAASNTTQDGMGSLHLPRSMSFYG